MFETVLWIKQIYGDIAYSLFGVPHISYTSQRTCRKGHNTDKESLHWSETCVSFSLCTAHMLAGTLLPLSQTVKLKSYEEDGDFFFFLHKISLIAFLVYYMNSGDSFPALLREYWCKCSHESIFKWTFTVLLLLLLSTNTSLK